MCHIDIQGIISSLDSFFKYGENSLNEITFHVISAFILYNRDDKLFNVENAGKCSRILHADHLKWQK